jgi:GTPase SAR1 family protein
MVLYLLWCTGNKKDLESERQVPNESAQEFAQHHNMLCHNETSAKDNVCVDESFFKLASVSQSLLLSNHDFS